jgi:hypothetical protein
MKCIFCSEEKDPVEFRPEHVFPESIGGRFTIQNVCSKCNNNLGTKVDCHLTNNHLVEGLRLIHGIEGKSGNLPNPFKEGVLDGDSKQKVQYQFSEEGKPKGVYLVQNHEVERLDDGGLKITVTGDQADERTIFEAVNKTLERNGFPKQTFEEFQAHSTKTSSFQQIRIDAQINLDELQRGLVKIAYELAHHWLGEGYFSDLEGCRLNEYLRDYAEGWEKRHSVKVDLWFDVTGMPFRFWESEDQLHIGLLTKVGERLCIQVRIFKLFCARVLVSSQAGDYSIKEMFISNNFLTGEVRDTEFAAEIARLVNEGKFKA